MPLLPAGFAFTGSLQGMSVYKMRGSDKLILRAKGGPTKKQIKTGPSFENTRRNNTEFGGRARAAQRVRRILSPLQFLADHNFTGPLNALFKHVQQMDTTSEWGKRGVLLSRHPRLLEGFNLNRRFLFDSIIKCPVGCNLLKETGQATIHVPALLPGINFTSTGTYPWFKIIAVLGLVPDLVYTSSGYRPEGCLEDFFPVVTETEWLQTNTGSAMIDLSLSVSEKPQTTSYSCLLAVGVAMGNVQPGGISPVRYTGGAKVLAVR